MGRGDLLRRRPLSPTSSTATSPAAGTSSRGFGKVADPLADRLMIGTAASSMLATGRIPIVAALVILGRDVGLVLGYGCCRREATSSR